MQKSSMTLTGDEQRIIKAALKEHIRQMQIKAKIKTAYSPEWRELAAAGALYKRFTKNEMVSL
ncbi:MAG: hypothetical protein J5706_02035 [Elusimicrobiales bacterium]|nr:hypothetical protein [Elusimicrobiales bacterium]